MGRCSGHGLPPVSFPSCPDLFRASISATAMAPMEMPGTSPGMTRGGPGRRRGPLRGCHELSCFVVTVLSRSEIRPPLASPRTPIRGPSLTRATAAAGEERDRPPGPAPDPDPGLLPEPKLGPGSSPGRRMKAMECRRTKRRESGRAKVRASAAGGSLAAGIAASSGRGCSQSSVPSPSRQRAGQGVPVSRVSRAGAGGCRRRRGSRT